MPKRKSKFTEELQQKYPCFRKGRDEFEAECITCSYGTFVSVANKGKLSLDLHVDVWKVSSSRSPKLWKISSSRSPKYGEMKLRSRRTPKLWGSYFNSTSDSKNEYIVITTQR